MSSSEFNMTKQSIQKNYSLRSRTNQINTEAIGSNETKKITNLDDIYGANTQKNVPYDLIEMIRTEGVIRTA